MPCFLLVQEFAPDVHEALPPHVKAALMIPISTHFSTLQPRDLRLQHTNVDSFGDFLRYENYTRPATPYSRPITQLTSPEPSKHDLRPATCPPNPRPHVTTRQTLAIELPATEKVQERWSALPSLDHGPSAWEFDVVASPVSPISPARPQTEPVPNAVRHVTMPDEGVYGAGSTGAGREKRPAFLWMGGSHGEKEVGVGQAGGMKETRQEKLEPWMMTTQEHQRIAKARALVEGERAKAKRSRVSGDV